MKSLIHVVEPYWDFIYLFFIIQFFFFFFIVQFRNNGLGFICFSKKRKRNYGLLFSEKPWYHIMVLELRI